MRRVPLGRNAGGRSPEHHGPPARRGPERSERRRLFAGYLLLVLATLVAYSPVFESEFVSYDDPDYVTGNEHVLQGVTVEGWNWAWTTRHAHNWHPLTWLSHQFDAEVFGPESALGPHVVNLVWHIATVLMLGCFLTIATGRSRAALCVAGVVALHPINVECVAWIAERKSVLAGFFWFATLAAYVWYARRKSMTRYLLAWAALVLGLLAKPMLVSLPVVLFMVDIWPPGRCSSRRSLGRLALEKLPFALPAAAIALATMWAHQSAVASDDRFSPSVRVTNAIVAYARYLRFAAWPSDLAVLYPHPLAMPPTTTLLVSSAILVSVTLTAWALRKRLPELVFGWSWYIVVLLPTIGLVQVGVASMADRYAYIPLVGVFVAVVWALSRLACSPARGRIFATLAVSAALVLGTLTHSQCLVWRDSQSLFEHALRVTKGNYIAHVHLAHFYLQRGDTALAVEHLEAARRLGWARDHETITLAVLLANQGNIRQARDLLQAVRRRHPRNASALYYLAALAWNENDVVEAKQLLSKALELDPDYTEARELLLQIDR